MASVASRPAQPKWSGCEWVTMHGVDVVDLEAGVLEALLHGLPRGRAGHADVDDGEAAIVEEAVHVHVAQARHRDRQLHPDDAVAQVGDRLRSRGPARSCG